MLDKYFSIVAVILGLTVLFTLGSLEGATQVFSTGLGASSSDGPLCLLLISLGCTALFLPRRKSSNPL